MLLVIFNIYSVPSLIAKFDSKNHATSVKILHIHWEQEWIKYFRKMGYSKGIKKITS